MSIEESFDWAKKQREEWDKLAQEHPMVTKLDTELTKGGDHPLAVIAFATTERPSYKGEVGRNGHGDLIFHFWPTANETYNALVAVPGQQKKVWVFGDAFADALAQSFIDEFKLREKLSWDFVPEMNSWVVKVQGFGDNILADQLSTKLFDTLHNRLER